MKNFLVVWQKLDSWCAFWSFNCLCIHWTTGQSYYTERAHLLPSPSWGLAGGIVGKHDTCHLAMASTSCVFPMATLRGTVLGGEDSGAWKPRVPRPQRGRGKSQNERTTDVNMVHKSRWRKALMARMWVCHELIGEMGRQRANLPTFVPGLCNTCNLV